MHGTVVSIGMRPLGPAGNYTVNYRVTSADGHVVAGSWSFQLTNRAPARPVLRRRPRTARPTTFRSGRSPLGAVALVGAGHLVVVAEQAADERPPNPAAPWHDGFDSLTGRDDCRRARRIQRSSRMADPQDRPDNTPDPAPPPADPRRRLHPRARAPTREPPPPPPADEPHQPAKKAPAQKAAEEGSPGKGREEAGGEEGRAEEGSGQEDPGQESPAKKAAAKKSRPPLPRPTPTASSPQLLKMLQHMRNRPSRRRATRCPRSRPHHRPAGHRYRWRWRSRSACWRYCWCASCAATMTSIAR